MHFKYDDDRPKNVTITNDPKIGQTVVWPFLIQGAMENPFCSATPPETISALLWTTIAVFGIVYSLLGYRCLRAIGFLSGLAIGAGIIYWLQYQNITLLGPTADSALAVIAGLIGAVIGSAHPIASALVSGLAGALIAGASMAICVATMEHHVFGEREILIAVAGGAIIFAVLTLGCAKLITVLASSIVGSAMIVSSIDFFMHGLDTINWILYMKPNPDPPPCWGGILICVWPMTAVISMIVQFFITAWRIDHKRRTHRRRHGHRMRTGSTRPRESREEARQRKYRYLYQVRTARGDIISQNYVSALQKRVQPGTGPPSEHSTKTSSNDRNTLNSDRTHFTNIPDSDADKMDVVQERM